MSSTSTPGSGKRSAPGSAESGSRKRRVVNVEEEMTSTSSFAGVTQQQQQRDVTTTTFVAVTAGKVGVEIHEVGHDGKFVRLYNSSDKVKDSEGEGVMVHSCGLWACIDFCL